MAIEQFIEGYHAAKERYERYPATKQLPVKVDAGMPGAELKPSRAYEFGERAYKFLNRPVVKAYEAAQK